MKALVYAIYTILIFYAVMFLIMAGMLLYSAYLQRQIDKGIEKLSRKEEDNDSDN